MYYSTRYISARLILIAMVRAAIVQ